MLAPTLNCAPLRTDCGSRQVIQVSLSKRCVIFYCRIVVGVILISALSSPSETAFAVSHRTMCAKTLSRFLFDRGLYRLKEALERPADKQEPDPLYPLHKKMIFKGLRAATPRRILFLGDGAAEQLVLPSVLLNLYYGPRSKMKRKVEVVRTDIDEVALTQLRFGSRQHEDLPPIVLMDHTKVFPFPDNHFGAIIMDRGLCFCNFDGEQPAPQHSPISCGGIPPSGPAVEIFFSEVVRVMAKGKRSRSFALLSGSAWESTLQYVKFWPQILKTLEDSQGVRVVFLGINDHLQEDLIKEIQISGRVFEHQAILIEPQ